MSLSSSGPAASLPSSATGDAPASTAGDGDERIRMQQLYRQHSSSLVRQLTRKTGCRELARELANETFLRLLRLAPGNIERIEQPEAFLRRVSTNLVRDWGRAKALRQRSQPALELASDQELDQVAALESRDLLRRLEEAVDKLKPRTREIFLAHRIHGFTYSEIAEQTGLSVKGVEKQMSKAIAKIDRLLDRG
jgi:RNA polymerase sigma factor (sigma-70 family)